MLLMCCATTAQQLRCHVKCTEEWLRYTGAAIPYKIYTEFGVNLHRIGCGSLCDTEFGVSLPSDFFVSRTHQEWSNYVDETDGSFEFHIPTECVVCFEVFSEDRRPSSGMCVVRSYML